MTPHEYWDELAAGYVLHGLTADEERSFVDHLEACADCTASVQDHEFVAAQLGSIAHFRETDDDAPSWESIRKTVVGPAEPDVGDLTARRRRYETSRRTLAAAAATVVVAGAGVAAWQLSSGGGTSCSAAAGCHQIDLDAAGGDRAASLVVRGDLVTMTPTAMSAAPPGKVYVLWQQPRDRRATPIAEFTAANPRPVAATLHTPYAETQQFAVSLENAGPAPATPSNQLASGVAS